MNCPCEEETLISDYRINNISSSKDPVTVVIFGASGDLTGRKLIPAFLNLFKDRLLPEHFTIIGFARREKTDGQFRNELKEMAGKILSHEGHFDDKLWNDYEKKLFYHRGSFDDPEAYLSLKERIQVLDGEKNVKNNRLYYLACGPENFFTVIENLSLYGLLDDKNIWSRVIIEKPFGHNGKTARELNDNISKYLSEEQIYRIDHYLGKETVQNILTFRFGNSIFEPIFNSKYVDHVQITVAESIGMEGRRGGYYDKSGALRDIVQNHMLQLLALVAMEPPVAFTAQSIQDEKVKCFRSIRPLTECCVYKKVVRGQYIPDENTKGYFLEDGVAKDSKTETYVALQLAIDNWRWAGVPFFMRTGKRLKKRITEIAIQFKTPPLNFFKTVECDGDICDIIRTEPNVIVFQVQPDESISMNFSAKRPGPSFLIQPVTMDFGYKKSFDKRLAEAYERLILDAIRGDKTLFPRFDEIEATWNIVDPILSLWEKHNDVSLYFYRPFTDGPEESEKLFSCCEGNWRKL